MGVGQQRGGRGLQGTPASLRPVGRGEERSLNAFQKISCEWPGRVIRIKLINPLLVSQGGNPDVAVYLFWISPFFFFFPSLFLLTPSSRRFLKGQGCLAALAELRALSAGVGPPLGPAATDTPLGGGGHRAGGTPQCAPSRRLPEGAAPHGVHRCPQPRVLQCGDPSRCKRWHHAVPVLRRSPAVAHFSPYIICSSAGAQHTARPHRGVCTAGARSRTPRVPTPPHCFSCPHGHLLPIASPAAPRRDGPAPRSVSQQAVRISDALLGAASLRALFVLLLFLSFFLFFFYYYYHYFSFRGDKEALEPKSVT